MILVTAPPPCSPSSPSPFSLSSPSSPSEEGEEEEEEEEATLTSMGEREAAKAAPKMETMLSRRCGEPCVERSCCLQWVGKGGWI